MNFPAKLIAADGQSLELRILGYQFPEVQSAEYDSNWLRIRGNVTHPSGRWMFLDPCLLTYEVAQLADWLEDLSRGEAVRSEISFIEPNISFRLHEDSGEKHLRVYFELESRPGWAHAKGAGMDDLYVTFPLDAANLFTVAQSLRAQLSEYPQRAER